MSVKCQVIMEAMDKLAPRYLAESWDNVGLLVGSPAQTVDKIRVCLDVTEQTVSQAIMDRIDLIIAHHPLIFKPLNHLRTDLPQGKLLAAVLKADLAIFSAHTNLDIARGGVNDILAGKLLLENTENLTTTYCEPLVKLVVFVPAEQSEQVRQAITHAGAGHIGKYSHCTFQTEGTGTFLPSEEANPFIGVRGKQTQLPECRLETIMPEKISSRVIKAMLKSHPYEEVAYDLYPLKSSGKVLGLGRLGSLPAAIPLVDFALQVKQALGLQQVKTVGDRQLMIRKVAVCGGSGAGLIKQAAFSGADILVSGDIKYHEAQEAQALGLALLDAGHYATEAPVVHSLVGYLRQCAAEGKWAVEISADESGKDIFTVI